MNESRDDLDDAALITRTLEGDMAAFGVLVRRHQAAVQRVATVVLGTREGADDVAQETFVRAYRALRTFHLDRRLDPWLFKIAANLARNQKRSAGRQSRLAVKVSAHTATAATDPPVEDRMLVIDALNQLRPADRLVIALRYFEDLAEQEMAVVLNCRPGTVKSRLARAMDRLRQEVSA